MLFYCTRLKRRARRQARERGTFDDNSGSDSSSDLSGFLLQAPFDLSPGLPDSSSGSEGDLGFTSSDVTGFEVSASSDNDSDTSSVSDSDSGTESSLYIPNANFDRCQFLLSAPMLGDTSSSEFSDVSMSSESESSESKTGWDADLESEDESDMESGINGDNTLRRCSHFVWDSIQQTYAEHYEEPREPIPRGPGTLKDVFKVYKERCPDYFRQELRISPHTFDCLIECLGNNPIFTNNSNNNQIPIDRQVAITLYRFGHHGNGVGLDKIA